MACHLSSRLPSAAAARRYGILNQDVVRSRTSLLIGFLPTTVLAREIQLQYSRKPVRCQRTTVSGVTKINDLFHPDHDFRRTTQNSLSTELSRGRGRFECRASSCCRRARFSRRSSSRERKPEKNPAEQMSKANKHQVIIAKTAPRKFASKSLILWTRRVLARHSS
jgi:hypothetical protein